MQSIKNIADLYHAKHGHFPNLATLSMAEIHQLHTELQDWKFLQSRKEQKEIKVSPYKDLILAFSCIILALLIGAQADEYGQLLINSYKGLSFVAIALVIASNIIVLLALTRKPN